MPQIVNATMNSVTALSSFSSSGWIVTLIVFLGIVGILFLILKNFRRVCYGAIPLGLLLIIFKIARWIGVSTEEGNYTPLTWLGYIFGFIVVSIIIGKFIEKFKFIKKIEKSFEIEEEKKCQDQK